MTASENSHLDIFLKHNCTGWLDYYSLSLLITYYFNVDFTNTMPLNLNIKRVYLHYDYFKVISDNFGKIFAISVIGQRLIA